MDESEQQDFDRRSEVVGMVVSGLDVLVGQRIRATREAADNAPALCRLRRRDACGGGDL